MRRIESSISIILILALIFTMLPAKTAFAFAGADDAVSRQQQYELFTGEVMRLAANDRRDCFVGNMTFTIGDPVMTVDGREKEIYPGMKAGPMIIEGNVMFPIRAIIEEVCGEYFWDASRQRISIKNDGQVIDLQIGSDTMSIDGELIHIGTAPAVINDTAMLPGEAIEKLGFEVNWDAEAQQAVLTRNFQTKRLIVTTSAEMDFSSLGAIEIVNGPDNLTILQFATIREAKVVQKQLEGKQNVVLAVPGLYNENEDCVSLFSACYGGVTRLDYHTNWYGGGTSYLYVSCADLGLNSILLQVAIAAAFATIPVVGWVSSILISIVMGVLLQEAQSMNQGYGVIIPLQMGLYVPVNISLDQDMRPQEPPISTPFTLTASNPTRDIVVGSGTAGRVSITITAPSTGSVSIWSSNLTSGSDPALYNSSGAKIADDEAGNLHFRYIIPAGQTMTVRAGTYSNVAARYTVTAEFPLFRITASPTSLNFGSDAVGYAQKSVQTVTITNAGNQNVTLNQLPTVSNWTLTPVTNWTTAMTPGQSRTFTIRPNNGLTAGTYNPTFSVTGSGGVNAQIQPTFTATNLETLTVGNPSRVINVAAGTTGRVPIRITAPSTGSISVQSSNLASGSDPALYDSSGVRIADDEAGNMHFRYTRAMSAGETMTIYAGTYSNVAARYTVTATFPVFAITASPTSLNFGSEAVGYTQRQAQTVTITNTGNQNVTLNQLPTVTNWTLTPGANWTTAMAPGQTRSFTVMPNNGLGAGTYNPIINITGSGGALAQIQTTFTVIQVLPPIFLTPGNSVVINVREGTTGRVPITITAPSNGSVSVQSSNLTSGYDPALYNGATSSAARIADDEAGNLHWLYTIPAGMTMAIYAGTYSNGAASYTVTATAPRFEINASPASPNFANHAVGYAQRPAQTVAITNTGNQNVTLNPLPTVSNWTLTPDANWTTAMPPNSIRTFTIMPNNGLGAGTYNTAFNVTGSGGVNVRIQPTFIVISPPISLTPGNPSEVIYVGAGVDGRVPITITALSTGIALVESSNMISGFDSALYSAAGSRIANGEAGDGYFRYSIPAGQTMTLYAGTYNNGSAIYTVTATFTDFRIDVSPAMPDFGIPEAGYAPRTTQTVTITNTGNQSVTLDPLPPVTNWTLTPGANWTTAMAPGETRSLTIAPNNGLGVGTYSPTIRINGSGGVTAQIQPTFTVLPFSPNGPTVIVSNEAERVGGTVTLNVSLANNPGISTFGLVMQYDHERLNYMTADEGDILTTGFRNDWRLSENQLRFRAYDPDGNNVSTGTTLFTVTFEIFEDIYPGIIDGEDLKFFYESEIFDGFTTSYLVELFDIEQGSIDVIEPFYGDVNGDGILNSADQTRMNKWFSDPDDMTEPFIILNADVDGVWPVNGSDQTRMNRFFSGLDDTPLGDPSGGVYFSDPCVDIPFELWEEYGCFERPAPLPISVTVSRAMGKAGEEVTLNVSLENNPGISNFGLVMQYDHTRLRYITAAGGDIVTTGFRDDWRLSENQLRFRAYDPDGNVNSGGSTLFTVTFEILDDTDPGIINGSDLLFFYDSEIFDGFTLIDDVELYGISQGEIIVIHESADYLIGIAVAERPAKMEYFVDDILDLTGMAVTAIYGNGSMADITGYTTDPIGDSILDKSGMHTVKVIYTENGITEETSFDITVNAAALASIEISSPEKTEYFAGDTLDLTGMTVTAIYNDGSTADITDYTTNPSDGAILNMASPRIVSVSYTENGITKEAGFEIILKAGTVVLTGIGISNPARTEYFVGETLDLSGMTVTALYSDGSTVNITGYTTDPANGSILNVAGSHILKVSYNENGITETSNFAISVTVLVEDPGFAGVAALAFEIEEEPVFIGTSELDIKGDGKGNFSLTLFGKTEAMTIYGGVFILANIPEGVTPELEIDKDGSVIPLNIDAYSEAEQTGIYISVDEVTLNHGERGVYTFHVDGDLVGTFTIAHVNEEEVMMLEVQQNWNAGNYYFAPVELLGSGYTYEVIYRGDMLGGLAPFVNAYGEFVFGQQILPANISREGLYMVKVSDGDGVVAVFEIVVM